MPRTIHVAPSMLLEWTLAYVHEGKTTEEIALDYGFTQGLVSRRLRAAGVPSRSKGARSGSRYNRFAGPLSQEPSTGTGVHRIGKLSPTRGHRRRGQI